MQELARKKYPFIDKLRTRVGAGGENGYQDLMRELSFAFGDRPPLLRKNDRHRDEERFTFLIRFKMKGQFGSVEKVVLSDGRRMKMGLISFDLRKEQIEVPLWPKMKASRDLLLEMKTSDDFTPEDFESEQSVEKEWRRNYVVGQEDWEELLDGDCDEHEPEIDVVVVDKRSGKIARLSPVVQSLSFLDDDDYFDYDDFPFFAITPQSIFRHTDSGSEHSCCGGSETKFCIRGKPSLTIAKKTGGKGGEPMLVYKLKKFDLNFEFHHIRFACCGGGDGGDQHTVEPMNRKAVLELLDSALANKK